MWANVRLLRFQDRKSVKLDDTPDLTIDRVVPGSVAGFLLGIASHFLRLPALATRTRPSS